MVYWIVKKYDKEAGNMIYISGLDKDGKPIHTTEKADAVKFHDLGVPMALYFEQKYCIEKCY